MLLDRALTNFAKKYKVRLELLLKPLTHPQILLALFPQEVMRTLKPLRIKHWVIMGFTLLFVVAVAFALLREIEREETLLKYALDGLVVLDTSLLASGKASIVRTDRLALFLVAATENQPRALRTITPLIPPTAFRVGLEHALPGHDVPVGEYWLIGITDKDGEIFRPMPGEVYGRSPAPIKLGSKKIRLVLSKPFQGGLLNQATQSKPPPTQSTGAQALDKRYGISGTVVASKALQSKIKAQERLIVLLFDPQLGRPVAFRIIESATLPARFSIYLPPAQHQNAKKSYDLRILTDHDNQPFRAVAGEVIGRSNKPIPLGTTNLRFELNQPYTR